MERRSFLTLGALALLPPAAGADDSRTLRLKDAPIRSALELLFRSFGQRNYVIDNSVIGFLSGNWRSDRLDPILERICQRNDPRLAWTRTERALMIQAAAPARTDVVRAKMAGAQLPLIDGIPCRMSGLVDGPRRFALLEIGALPRTGVEVVRVGSRTRLGNAGYRVAHIGDEGLVLKGERTFAVPFVGLWPAGGEQ